MSSRKHPDKRLRILMEVHPGLYDGDAFEEQLRRLFASGFQTKYVVSTGDRNGTPFSQGVAISQKRATDLVTG